MQLLLQLPLPLLGLIDLLLLLLVELLLLLQTLLDPHPQFILVLGLLIAHLVGLRALQVISDVLGGAELPSYLYLLLYLLRLVLYLYRGLVVVHPRQACVSQSGTFLADLASELLDFHLLAVDDLLQFVELFGEGDVDQR